MKLTEVLNQGPQDYKLFCDLDGVLCDFVAGVRRLYPTYTEEQYESNPKFRKEMWDKVKEHAKQGGELWKDLDPMPDAHQLWNYIKPHDPIILTATGTGVPSAGEQKKHWVKSYLGNNPVILVPAAKDKQKYAARNHVLIDDKKKAIDPWVAAGGIGILHTSAANTIEQLKKLGF